MDKLLSKSIFGSYSPQDPPQFRLYRTPLDTIKELNGNFLQILMLRSDGYKFPRNNNAHPLELYCSAYFFGPLVIAMNSRERSYILESFDLQKLELIKNINEKLHKNYPPPNFNTNSENHNTIDDCLDIEGRISDELKGQEKDLFYMYKYKTAYCPYMSKKHDWTLCNYAHRFTDYRRPLNKFDYSPEECKKIDLEIGQCPDGDTCKYSHSTVERLYHPLKYKTNPCDCLRSDEIKCKRGKNCAFYHSIEERRQSEVPIANPFNAKKSCSPETAADSSDDQLSNDTSREHISIEETLEKNAEFNKPHIEVDMRQVIASFCSSKGLPYYTELAFADMNDLELDEVEEIIEDKFNVLEQIETPRANGDLF